MPPVMPRWLKIMLFIGTVFSIFLFVMVFESGIQGHGSRWRSGDVLFYALGGVLLAGLTFWSFLTWLIYRSLRDKNEGLRISFTVIFFLFPLIWLFLTFFS